MIETLAVIAWKAPVLQSEVVRIRTNKAYDHLSELESSGFISRAKHGRTKLVKLTDRFFSYFDVKNAEDVKAKFKVQEPEQQEQQQATALAAEDAQGSSQKDDVSP